MVKIKQKEKEENKGKKNQFFPPLLLWQIIKKNFKLILRSRGSSLIVLLGPLIIIALVGTAYNTSNIYDIRIGAYSDSYNELTESLLKELGGQQFSTVKFETKESCVNSLKAAEIHVCVIFPKNLETGSPEPIEFMVDQSRVNLVWIIIDALSSKVSTKKTEISLQLASAILGTLTDTRSTLHSKESDIGALMTKNEEIKNVLEEISSSVGGINADLVGVTEFGKIGQKLDEFIVANNFSSDVFSSLYAVLTLTKTNLETVGASLGEFMANISLKVSEAQGDVGTSKDSLTSINSVFSELKSSIDSITGTSAETVVTPLKTHITPIATEKTHLSFLFPTLLVLIVMLISLLLSSALVVREKLSFAYFRNYITPAQDWIFLLGHFLTSFIIVSIQLIILFGVASFFFKSALLNVLGNASIALIVIVAIFILCGMLIGYLFKSEETSLLATVFLASLFLFFSNTILPLETLPVYLKNIANFNPFVLSESILKKIMLFKVGFVGVSDSLFILGGYIILLAIVVLGVEKIVKVRAH